MTFFGSQNTGRTPFERTFASITPSSNVHVSACSTGLRYKLYLVEVVFPPPKEPWVSNNHIPPKTIVAVFG